MISVPGKVFLLGEYAVLEGRPAVVAAISPRFSLEPARQVYPQGSPAGRLLAAAGESEGWVMRDPHAGAGGFGASTAAFALCYRKLAESRGWSLSAEAVWKRYRELQAVPGVPPSGADLFAQWSGGVVRFDPAAPSRSERIAPRAPVEILVLSATGQDGRKVATHQHLAALQKSSRDFTCLDAPLESGISALQSGDARALGRAMNDYGSALASIGLELEETARDREALSRMPGVFGIKGTGAMQADALVVVLDPSSPRASHRSLVSAARSRGLVPVFEGWPTEEGVRCER